MHHMRVVITVTMAGRACVEQLICGIACHTGFVRAGHGEMRCRSMPVVYAYCLSLSTLCYAVLWWSCVVGNSFRYVICDKVHPQSAMEWLLIYDH